MKKTLFITALTLALTGCASIQQAKEYDELVVKAKAEIKLADQAGFTWRDSEKFLKDADEAVQAGDRDKAIKLVKKAIKQAQLSQQQAKDNTNAKPVF